MRSKGIPFGALWGFLVLLIYAVSFAGIGIYLLLGTDFSHFSWKFVLGGGAKIMAYFIGGAIIFVPTLFIALYLVIRDRDLAYTVKRHWPLFLLGIYLLVFGIPTLPEGVPVDALVSLIMLGLEMMIKRWVTERKSEFEGAQREQIEQ